jgi:hypothetical protein
MPEGEGPLLKAQVGTRHVVSLPVLFMELSLKFAY